MREYWCGCCFITVKGMWERKPSDWPEHVRFLDPNNKMKDNGGVRSKPTKEILVPMLVHLVRTYVVRCCLFYTSIFFIICFSYATVYVVHIVLLW